MEPKHDSVWAEIPVPETDTKSTANPFGEHPLPTKTQIEAETELENIHRTLRVEKDLADNSMEEPPK